MNAPIKDSHPIRLRNSATGDLSAFIPRDWRAPDPIPDPERRVGVYLCGPTVYDRAHIGNARPAVVFDVLVRLLNLTYPGQVRFVRNFTDVEDKINDRAAERYPDLAPLDAIARVTEETIGWYHEDMAALGVALPDDEPRATAYIGEMVEMIATLIANGHAYEAEGHVLFDVDSYSEYGALSGRDTEDMLAGARVEVAPYKKHPMDFVLWKPSTDAQPGWPSPWGRGRPGWHIECSAMAKALLGTDFDIHGGGSDLLFPHHENERAQSCCADPGHGFAEIWLHNGMIRVDGRKMSKSLGNFFTVQDKRAEMSGDVIRYILLNAHYRDELDWTEDRVEQARAAVTRLNRLAERYRRAAMIAPAALIPHASVLERLNDDLDTHGALAALHALASEAINPAETDFELIRPVVETARWLGFSLGLEAAAETGQGDDLASDDTIIDAACGRLDAARAAKDYAEADRIRALLDGAGLVVQTTKSGTTAERGAAFDRTRLEDLK